MNRRLLTIAPTALLCLGVVAPSEVPAANLDVILRHLQLGPTYGCHCATGCQDCTMPWQPIQTRMHCNVLPNGVWRPFALRKPDPWLAPRTPHLYRGVNGCGRGCGGCGHCSPHHLAQSAEPRGSLVRITPPPAQLRTASAPEIAELSDIPEAGAERQGVINRILRWARGQDEDVR